MIRIARSDPKVQRGPLNAESLAQGIAFLRTLDRDFALIISELGPPPMWGREPGFPTLVRIILEQQVSLASARAAFENLIAATRMVTPQNFITLNDRRLKKIGFSRQKAGYCRGLAVAILKKDVDLDALAKMDDASARSALMGLKGVGPWTADIYLLMALKRPDIWPSGDLALAVSLQEVRGLPSRPNREQLDQIALQWRPWRAVAARLLWHHYLSKRRKRNEDRGNRKKD